MHQIFVRCYMSDSFRAWIHLSYSFADLQSNHFQGDFWGSQFREFRFSTYGFVRLKRLSLMLEKKTDLVAVLGVWLYIYTLIHLNIYIYIYNMLGVWLVAVNFDCSYLNVGSWFVHWSVSILTLQLSCNWRHPLNPTGHPLVICVQFSDLQ